MDNSYRKELARKWADEEEELKKEDTLHPLAKYSTTQLKAELRRRKKER